MKALFLFTMILMAAQFSVAGILDKRETLAKSPCLSDDGQYKMNYAMDRVGVRGTIFNYSEWTHYENRMTVRSVNDPFVRYKINLDDWSKSGDFQFSNFDPSRVSVRIPLDDGSVKVIHGTCDNATPEIAPIKLNITVPGHLFTLNGKRWKDRSAIFFEGKRIDYIDFKNSITKPTFICDLEIRSTDLVKEDDLPPASQTITMTGGTRFHPSERKTFLYLDGETEKEFYSISCSYISPEEYPNDTAEKDYPLAGFTTKQLILMLKKNLPAEMVE